VPVRLLSMLSGKQGVARRQRIVDEGEEMTIPGPPWTPEEDGLLRSMGGLAKAPPRLQRCSSAKRRGVHQRAHLLEIKLARSLPGPKPKWK
jgi:hypothetical protein